MIDATQTESGNLIPGTIALILGVALCSWAGNWQLNRAQQKRDIYSAFELSAEQPALPALVPESVRDDYYFRRFALYGRYDSERQFLIDNMMRESRLGYEVLTPFHSGGEIVLVNRGWVPANPDRSQVPDIPVDGKMRNITARLNRLPRAGIELTTPVPPADAPWPRRVSFPKVEAIERQLGGIQVRDYQLLLDSAEDDGFNRDWRPNLMSPEKHVAYAVQWFALALAMIVVYGVMLIRGKRVGG